MLGSGLSKASDFCHEHANVPCPRIITVVILVIIVVIMVVVIIVIIFMISGLGLL